METIKNNNTYMTKYCHEYFLNKISNRNENICLSNINIFDTMKPYENTYPNFIFYDVMMCKNNAIFNKIDYDSIKGNKLGIIFLLDVDHRGLGSYWTSLYIDIEYGQINYFDSRGQHPPKNIQGLIDDFVEYYYKKHNSKPKPEYNTNVSEDDNSYGGISSCRFIINKIAR